jgi:hypothetical protein
MRLKNLIWVSLLSLGISGCGGVDNSAIAPKNPEPIPPAPVEAGAGGTSTPPPISAPPPAK